MKDHRLTFRTTDRDKFEEIAKGIKTIETRAATQKYKAVQSGDSLTFVCGNDRLTKTVAKVEHFNSLEEMFSKLPLNSILPSAKNLNEAKKVYYDFPNYQEKIEATGIIAFSLSP